MRVGAAVVLLLALCTYGYASPIWKVFCAGQPVFRGRLDPIVNPGTVSGHSHFVSGSNFFSAASVDQSPLDYYNTIMQSTCTSCSIGQVDLSQYWHPDLYYRWPNGTFSLVPDAGLTVYYLSRNGYAANQQNNWQPIPKGLRIVAGDMRRRQYTGTIAEKAISYACLSEPGGPETPGFPTADRFCRNGLRLQVFFPMCWDGVNLDSPDHRSHMAYPIQDYNGGDCPSTHPVRIPGVFFEAFYSVSSFPHGEGTNPFVLSNGDPTGYGFHGDFVSGWDEEVMRAAIAHPSCDISNTLLAIGNNVSACVPLAPYVQRTSAGSCIIGEPIPLTEDLGMTHPIAQLPGCNPLTYGPQNAVPCSSGPKETPSLGVDKRFLLKSKLNGLYVTGPELSSVPMTASITVPTLMEVWGANPLEGGKCLQNEGTGRFASASGSGSTLMANRGSVSDWELFEVETQTNGEVAIIANRNGKYVSVQADGTLVPDASAVTGDAQLFVLETPDGGHVGEPLPTPTTPYEPIPSSEHEGPDSAGAMIAPVVAAVAVAAAALVM